MRRLSSGPALLRTCFASLVAAGLIAAALPHATQAADGTKQLQRVKGDVGYATVADAGDFKPVFGKLDLPNDDYAVTKARSAATIALPDSSLISMGENTAVQVGAFDTAAAAPGSTITVKGGTLRFDIKRPAGGAANYHFQTPTSQVAVRGTIGLLSFVNGITTVGCVACAADSVVVTVGSQTFALVTGQFLAVSALGAVTTGALGGVAGAFTGAGVSVSPTAGAGAAAGGAAAGAVVPAVAAGAAAAAAVGIAASSHSPSPANTPQLSLPTPVPSGIPTGTVNLTNHGATRAPQAVPAPAAAPVAAPSPHPPVAPHLPGRLGR